MLERCVPFESVVVDLWAATATSELAGEWSWAVPAGVVTELERRRPVERDRRIVQLALRRSVAEAQLARPLDAGELATLTRQGQPKSINSLRVSASHHDDLTALAVGSVPIGVDIEPEYEPDWDAALDVVLTDDELSHLRELPLSDQPRAYFGCWTLKEAVMKTLGEGLSDRDPQTVHVTLPPRPAALLCLDGAPPADRWALCTVPFSAGYVASVAARGASNIELRRYSWPLDLAPARW
jgi:4'-phosphopantetheinyl transferase